MRCTILHFFPLHYSERDLASGYWVLRWVDTLHYLNLMLLISLMADHKLPQFASRDTKKAHLSKIHRPIQWASTSYCNSTRTYCPSRPKPDHLASTPHTLLPNLPMIDRHSMPKPALLSCCQSMTASRKKSYCSARRESVRVAQGRRRLIAYLGALQSSFG